MRFQGSLVAIVTPMKDGGVDLRALRELTEWQLAEGTDGIVPCGTTGEGVTLTAQERSEVVRAVVETVRGRAAVIAGAGSNATHECIESVKRVKELGADAALVVTPYYNKPTQEGLYRHYLAIQEATRFPIVAYNVPSRTAGDLLPETVARLAKAGAIVGLKEATANMDRQVQLVEKVGKDAIAWLSGDDFTVLPYIACGGHGVISVVTNIAPRAMKDLVSAALRGDYARALERQVALAELNRAMFIETNPGPVKAAVALMGRAGPDLRLP
ncbi:MAG TPA: 4-hydroxy-tetrahydrodipicolinate synthase, partial [Anaeromyxobacteraceae bacterium]